MRSLRSTLFRIANVSLLASSLVGVAGATGCGADAIDRSGFETPAFCTASSPIEQLRVDLGVDWVGLMWGDENGEEAGTRCANATDAAACIDAVKAAASQTRRELAPGQTGPAVLVTTKGGEVRVAAMLGELTSVLGPVDTPSKAYMAVRAYGYSIECRSWVRPARDGFEVIARYMTAACDPIVIEERKLHVGRDGRVTVLDAVEAERESGACVGRRPEGLVLAGASEGDALGRWFARAAQLEAASVDAFLQLSAELTRHGAAAGLIARAKRAARDEVRHAAAMKRLAHRFGGRYEAPSIACAAKRSIVDLARENAVEGCIRETYGVIEASLQGTLAGDAVVARTMRRIATDEARHAELSWDVHAWAMKRLSEKERKEVRASMRNAVVQLGAELARPVDPALASRARLPRPETALRALSDLEAVVTAAA